MGNLNYVEAVKKILKDNDEYKVPIDPVKIAKNLGIDMYDIEFSNPNISGVISKENERTTILVNKNDSYNRKRFTIAHELGHWHLHMNNKNRTIEEYYRGACNSIEESEANNLAAELLMPTNLVAEEFKKLEYSTFGEIDEVEILADKFKVSKEAMGYRLNNLGLMR